MTNVKKILLTVSEYCDCKNFRELAAKIEVSEGTIYSWISRGSIGSPEKILDKCKEVNLKYLQTGEGPMLSSPNAFAPSNVRPAQEPRRPPKRIPVISSVQAGEFEDVEDQFSPGHADEWVTTTETNHEYAFALVVEGDSMSPEFQEGEIITVDPGRQPHNDSYVIAKNGNWATFKQLVIVGGSIFLKPLNDRYPIKDVTGVELRIVGVVVERRKTY